jgi:hypothetical protein
LIVLACVCVAQHYSTFQPALESMRLKYEQAMKDKMLMKLERDRVKTRVWLPLCRCLSSRSPSPCLPVCVQTDALEEQLRAWESGTRSGTAGPADRGSRLFCPLATSSSVVAHAPASLVVLLGRRAAVNGRRVQREQVQ